MKGYFRVVPAVFLMTGLCSVPAFGANRVPELSVDVTLQEDGSAYITQEFTAVTDEGTEFYLDYLDSGYLTITDYQVSDENGPYTVLEHWDVDASFEEKAGRCGQLPIDGGDELCWGITEYGEHRYAVEYVLHDLTGGYSGSDGFNYRFVNADMGFFPTDVTLTIRSQDGTPLTDENCGIWAFGYDGSIVFEDGVIRAWTESPLEGDANMTVMVELDKGILHPTRLVDQDFQLVKDAAMAGSDYEDGEDLTLMDYLLIALVVAVLIAGFIAAGPIARKLRSSKLKRQMNETPYFRDTPNEGNLNASYRLGNSLSLCEDGVLLGTRLLRLITQGCLEPVSKQLDSREICLRLVKEPCQNGDEYDEMLYTILESAAGPDGILQPKELKRFSEDHWEVLNRFLEQCDRDGTSFLMRRHCLRVRKCRNIKDLTGEGRAQLAELLGLKRFLLDFSLIRERYAGEAFIWQDYMVYAMLLGIADQVANQFKELYPKDVMDVEQYTRQIGWASGYNYLMYDAMVRQQQKAEEARRGGGGGHASFGGGGGYSGGGGGGTR